MLSSSGTNGRAALLRWQENALVNLIFSGSMISPFASIITFIGDINLCQHVLKLELETVENKFD